MIDRDRDRDRLQRALAESPAVLIVGARQVGKSTLARAVAEPGALNYFDLEDPADAARLAEPMTALRDLRGVVVIDEVQRHPDLFPVLRVLADRPDRPATFLLLGSASRTALRQSSESLAGRIEVQELGGFGAADPTIDLAQLWLRGGYPRSYLATSDGASMRWRRQYVRTLANADLSEFGLALPAATVERFLGLVAHYHGNLWNAAAVARSIGIGETTARRYVEGLADAMLVRILQPWSQNTGKRLVRTPKVYLRDAGLTHALLGIESTADLLRHPMVGATWESLVIDEAIRRAPDGRAWFWRTANGAELDLLVEDGGRRYGIEVKRADAPRASASMRTAVAELDLDALWVVYPGGRRYPVADRITALPIAELVTATSLGELV